MVGHTDYRIGDLKWSVQNSDHDFWLKCDGRSIRRAIYPALFDLIGTTYGSANSETFNLPDCRGRVVGCIGSGVGLTARTAGASVGTETHTLTVSEMPSHSHTVTDPGHNHATTDPGHAHATTDPGHSHNVGNTIVTNGVNTTTALDSSPPPEINLADTQTTTSTTSTTGVTVNSNTTGLTVNTNTTGITLGNTGGGNPHNNMQPTIFIGNVFIAYKTQVSY